MLTRAARRIGFTKKSIEAIKLPITGRTYVYDSRSNGLAVCVTAAGARAFYLVGARVAGRAVRIKLGSYPKMTIEQARSAAKKTWGQIADGKDPLAGRRGTRQESSLGDVFLWYLETHAKPHKRTWQGDQASYDRYLTPWNNRKLSQITRDDVQRWHVKLGKRNGIYAANRALALLRTIYNKALANGWKGENPATRVAKFREQSRERFLQADELPRFFAALAAEPEVFQHFYTLALLTGARRGNLLAARWEEFNFDAMVWSVPGSKSKAGRPIQIPLAPAAIEILKRRHRDADGSEWVFPTCSTTGHLVDPTKIWTRICKTAKLRDLRMHDLRRSLGSWAAAGGASLPLIGKLLGHTQAQTTQVYARLNLDPVRAVVNQATAAMLTAAGMEHDLVGQVVDQPEKQ